MYAPEYTNVLYLYALLWISIVVMPIRIRLSIMMPIRIRILPQAVLRIRPALSFGSG